MYSNPFSSFVNVNDHDDDDEEEEGEEIDDNRKFKGLFREEDLMESLKKHSKSDQMTDDGDTTDEIESDDEFDSNKPNVPKEATLSYVLELIKKQDIDKLSLKKTDEILKTNGIELQRDTKIVHSEFMHFFAENLENIMKEFDSTRSYQKFMKDRPPEVSYSAHLDYWREALYSKNEYPCGQNKGVCLFEKDIKPFLPQGKYPFRLRQFLNNDVKCIYCYFKRIQAMYKRFVFNEMEVSKLISLNPQFCYKVDLHNEYPSTMMLTQYEKKQYFGLLGPMPDIDLNDMEYVEHKGNGIVVCGVKHKFYKE